jgi:murein DD-endopeptidase MepM/ murein hydrolase activator NlpD
VPAPRPQGEHSFLRGQLIGSARRRFARKAAREARAGAAAARHAQQGTGYSPEGYGRRAERVRPSSRAGTPAPAHARAARISLRGLARAAARRPWLLIGLVIVALALVLFPSFGLAQFPVAQAHPAIPAPPDVDQALYGILIPEPAARQQGDVNPALLTSLKVTPYTTRGGDTISTIAARFKLNIDTIVSWNDIRDARRISTGTALAVPNANGLKYSVRRGDTLQGIALSSGIELNKILDWNRLSSSVISVGQELFLPGARMNPGDLNRILGNLFVYPVLGRISSYFGERPDPFTGVANMHNGVDIVNKPLSPIGAAMDGMVAGVGFNNNYGNYVILKHTGSYQTLYGHLTRYLVSKGQKVRQGQEIGELGTTGYSTGPHLHFSIFHNGEAVDPMRFLK